MRVEPGIVLDQLNASLAAHGLFFPVDVSPANRATIGGMTGNNSCGARSIRYGNMVHNVHAINAVLADGSSARFAAVPGNFDPSASSSRYVDLVQRMRDLGARHQDAIERRFPKLLRRVGGYNIDSIDAKGHNMAHLLVGSEGTLGFFTEIELDLQPIPAHRVLGVCHFETFYQAMETTQHIVALDPTAVELADSTLLELARDIAMFRPTIERFVKASPPPCCWWSSPATMARSAAPASRASVNCWRISASPAASSKSPTGVIKKPSGMCAKPASTS